MFIILISLYTVQVIAICLSMPKNYIPYNYNEHYTIYMFIKYQLLNVHNKGGLIMYIFPIIFTPNIATLPT